MKKGSFTLVEIIIVIVIVAVLITVGIPAYQTFLENSNAKVCQANLDALAVALNIYAMEHDSMPGDLSEIPADCLQKAYAQILQRKEAWEIKLAYFVVGWQERGLAYAGLLQELAKGNTKLLTCPSDSTPPSAGGRSYGMNMDLRNITSQAYRSLADDTLLIADCESNQFNNDQQLQMRHKHPRFLADAENYAQGVDKKRRLYERTREGLAIGHYNR